MDLDDVMFDRQQNQMFASNNVDGVICIANGTDITLVIRIGDALYFFENGRVQTCPYVGEDKRFYDQYQDQYAKMVEQCIDQVSPVLVLDDTLLEMLQDRNYKEFRFMINDAYNRYLDVDQETDAPATGILATDTRGVVILKEDYDQIINWLNENNVVYTENVFQNKPG